MEKVQAKRKVSGKPIRASDQSTVVHRGGLQFDITRINPRFLRRTKTGRSLNGRRSVHFPELYIAGIAQEIGVVPSHITKLLSANNFYPSFPIARKLARVLGLRFGDFIDMLDGLKLQHAAPKSDNTSPNNSPKNETAGGLIRDPKTEIQ